MVIKSGADMLIETRVALDKVESFRNESFEPEEIQLFLNKSQFRLLDDLINKNFQQGTLRYEWLRPFQKPDPTPINPIWTDAATVKADIDFPADLYYLISASATSTISATSAEAVFDDNCTQPITDPNIILNPKTKDVQLDIIETGQAIDRTHNNFYGNNKRSPRAEALTNGLRIYRDETFIISAVLLEYIIEPTEIDVTSATELPWSVSANEKIIDYTVEYMRLTIGDPLYQGNVNDFNTRTQNA